MNRRSLIKSIILWLGALFVPAKLVRSQTVSLSSAEVFAVNEDFCLQELKELPDEVFVALCDRINKKIHWILQSCQNDKKPITHLSIHYRNILNQTANPDGSYPFFRIIARRGDGGTYQPLNGIIIADGEWNL